LIQTLITAIADLLQTELERQLPRSEQHFVNLKDAIVLEVILVDEEIEP
jgi:hypothetical protein